MGLQVQEAQLEHSEQAHRTRANDDDIRLVPPAGGLHADGTVQHFTFFFCSNNISHVNICGNEPPGKARVNARGAEPLL
jgi:hypothetical protein